MKTRNGHVDDGTQLRGQENARCPACGAAGFIVTLSEERCTACGIVCDYWGGGTNAAYEVWLERRDQRDQETTIRSPWYLGCR